MIATYQNKQLSFSEYLEKLGWEFRDRLQSAFRLDTNAGEAVLSRSPASSQSGWSGWCLESPHLPVCQRSDLFAANGGLPGPWKFVLASNGAIECRSDIPHDVLVTDDTIDLATGKTFSPMETWVESVTALAKGEAFELDAPKPNAGDVVTWLKERGFVASLENEAVRVTVPLTGSFREVAVDWQDGGGVHLSAELGRLADWEETSKKAASDFLHEANRRLKLVRIAEHAETLGLRMEARFCAPGPGVWLQSALEALCTGMALVVQPLASLRDPRVADMLLAGKKAKEGGVRWPRSWTRP